ncbi:MAG: hypothetical protein ACXWC0_27460, partial [Burkholderiales bacterium]
MRHHKIHRGEDRRIVAKVYIDMVHEMRAALRKFGSDEIDKDQSPGQLLLVGAAVTVGSVEGRPMSATK